MAESNKPETSKREAFASFLTYGSLGLEMGLCVAIGLGMGYYLVGPYLPSTRFSLAPDGKSFATPVRKLRIALWMLEGFNSRRGWFSKW